MSKREREREIGSQIRVAASQSADRINCFISLCRVWQAAKWRRATSGRVIRPLFTLSPLPSDDRLDLWPPASRPVRIHHPVSGHAPRHTDRQWSPCNSQIRVTFSYAHTNTHTSPNQKHAPRTRSVIRSAPKLRQLITAATAATPAPLMTTGARSRARKPRRRNFARKA